MAQRNPDILYIAMERDASVTLAAVENASNLELKYIFINGDAGLIENYFGEEEVDCLYLNFSDPWTRQNKPKRRLTYRDFLEKYKVMMKPGAKLCFKTDNDELFDFSLEEFRHCGFTLTELTRDLHNSEYDPDNVRTNLSRNLQTRVLISKSCSLPLICVRRPVVLEYPKAIKIYLVLTDCAFSVLCEIRERVIGDFMVIPGNRYIPYENRQGRKAVVYFTRNCQLMDLLRRMTV